MTVTYWNKTSESFGITADQAMGKSLWDLFPLSLEEPMHSFILGVQRGEKATRFVQSYGQGDEETSFEITAYPFRDGTSVIARDISDGFELHIEDDGIGLPPDFSFKKNSRLGLQTVTGIVEHQLGGSVAIIPASGAAFLVTIKPRESQKTLPLD